MGEEEGGSGHNVSVLLGLPTSHHGIIERDLDGRSCGETLKIRLFPWG